MASAMALALDRDGTPRRRRGQAVDIRPKGPYNEYGPACTVRRFPDVGAVAAQPTTHRAAGPRGSPLQSGAPILSRRTLAETLA
jgi:hypothetical protein